VIGKAALRIFLQPEIELITTQFNFDEVLEYLPRLASRYHLDETSLSLQLRMLPLRVFSEKHYKIQFPKAGKLLQERDSDDAHLAALALAENVPVWSNDKDFEKLPFSVYTTARLLRIFEGKKS